MAKDLFVLQASSGNQDFCSDDLTLWNQIIALVVLSFSMGIQKIGRHVSGVSSDCRRVSYSSNVDNMVLEENQASGDKPFEGMTLMIVSLRKQDGLYSGTDARLQRCVNDGLPMLGKDSATILPMFHNILEKETPSVVPMVTKGWRIGEVEAMRPLHGREQWAERNGLLRQSL
uniref:Uncharacterized protein n=1 Tax=Vitis vinifera TaxID=29760 RepID=A5B5F6_VITVI|nr:hypothetical protein VITISV_012442 [Vitis vinifera]